MTLHQKTLLIFLITAASVVGTFITPGVANLKCLFSITDSYLSYIMTSYLFGYLIGIIFYAILSKKYGGISSIRCGLLISLMGSILQYISVISKGYELFLLGRFITAFGLSSGLVCGFAIIKNNISQYSEKSYFSTIAVAFTGSIYISILIAATLIKTFNIDSIFIFQIFYSILLLLFTKLIPDTIIINSINFTDFFSKFSNLKLISYAYALSLTTIIAYCYAFYAPLIMINSFKQSQETYAYYNLLNLFGLLIGSSIYKKIHSLVSEEKIALTSLLIFIAISLIMVALCVLKTLNLKLFIFIFFSMNILSGLLYPAGTYLSMEYGTCKQSSSAIMNIIKIGMPSIALSFSSMLGEQSLLKLPVTIIFFSFIALILLIASVRNYP